MKQNINKEKYIQIKEMAKVCIDEIYSMRNGLTTIENYINKYKSKLNSKEEMLLFQSMVLFPDTDSFLKLYKEDKNINKLIIYYGVPSNIILSKIMCIDKFETKFEDKNTLLKISDINVLEINKNIFKMNCDIDRAVKMINDSKQKNKK